MMTEETKTSAMVGFGDLFKNSWEVFTKVWVDYLWLYLLTLVVVGGIVFVTVGGAIVTAVIGGAGSTVTPAVLYTAGPIAFIGLIVAILAGIIFALAIINLVYRVAEGKTETFKTSMSYAFKNYLKYLWVSFVLGLILVIGYIFLVIPGIIASVFFFAVPAIFIIEDNHTLNVLKRSSELVSGYFWPVLGRLAVLVLVGAVVGAITGYVPFLNLVVSFVLAPFSMAYMYFIYADLKKIKA